MLKLHKIRIAEVPGQIFMELWVKNIVPGLFFLDNTPGFHGNRRMLKLGKSFEILQWMWGVFSILYMNFFIMHS